MCVHAHARVCVSKYARRGQRTICRGQLVRLGDKCLNLLDRLVDLQLRFIRWFFFHGHTGLTDLGKRMRGGHLVFSLLHTKLCMLPALLSPLDNDRDCLAEVVSISSPH